MAWALVEDATVPGHGHASGRVRVQSWEARLGCGRAASVLRCLVLVWDLGHTADVTSLRLIRGIASLSVSLAFQSRGCTSSAHETSWYLGGREPFAPYRVVLTLNMLVCHSQGRARSIYPAFMPRESLEEKEG